LETTAGSDTGKTSKGDVNGLNQMIKRRIVMKKTNFFQSVCSIALVFIILLSTSCSTPEVDHPAETGIGIVESTEPEATRTPTQSTGYNEPPIENAIDLNEGECELPPHSLNVSGTSINGIVDGQVVLTGNREIIIDVVDAFTLTTLGSDYPNPLIDLPDVDLGSDLPIDIYLFQLEQGESVWESVGDINEYILGNINDGGVQFAFAEPNYVTIIPFLDPDTPATPGEGSTSADPCSGCSGGISGDPCSGCSGGINGDPCSGCSGGISGDPSAVISATEVLSLTQREFLNQWAFSSRTEIKGNIGLYDNNYEWTAKNISGTNYTGSEVEIAVFDTVPSAINTGTNYIYWASVPFRLCAWKPGVMVPPPGGSQSTRDEKQIELQEHGLFVTGLAQGVAPNARFTLIEVLNSQAKGDVASLLYGMEEFAKVRRVTNAPNPLINMVFNLSLGLELEKFPRMQDAAAETALQKSYALLEQEGSKYCDRLGVSRFPSAALKCSLTAYEQEGAVIVAAAGNDCEKREQIPAAFSNVLGVSSNNSDANLSCFSNFGDVAAPGGDGAGSSCSLDMALHCSDYSDNIGSCPNILISIISRNPAELPVSSLNKGPGFGYWAGTSMSTPLVSGLAALVLEQCPNTLPEAVRNWITLPYSRTSVVGVGETIELACPANP
jgi:subtilisin family serine protease